MTDDGLCNVVCGCCGLALPQRLPQADLQHWALAGILPLPVHLQGKHRVWPSARALQQSASMHQASAHEAVRRSAGQAHMHHWVLSAPGTSMRSWRVRLGHGRHSRLWAAAPAGHRL